MHLERIAAYLCLAFGLAPLASANDAYTVTTPGKPGTDALVPQLAGSGPLSLGSVSNALQLSEAVGDGTAFFVLGASEVAAPLKGGILGPAPTWFFPPLSLDGSGQLTLPFGVPESLPVGVQLWTQAWIADAGASFGFAASNSLRLTVQPAPAVDAALYPAWTLALAGSVDFDTPGEAVVGDFDGDGDEDFAALLPASGFDGVAVSLGIEGARFAAPSLIATAQELGDLEVGDLDGDGALDLVATALDDDALVVLLGDGAGSFAAPQLVAVNPEPVRLLLEDLNGDDELDAVVTHGAFFPTSQIDVYLGDGAGGFAATPLAGPPGSDRPAELIDVDVDGHLDLCILRFGTPVGSVDVHPGLGDGNFGAPIVAEMGITPVSLTVGDVNSDGVQDLVVLNDNSESVTARYGVGDGSFSPANDTPAPVLAVFSLTQSFIGPTELIDLGDMNADGELDLILREDNGIPDDLFALANGDGSFGAPQALRTRPALGDLVGDFDDDGALDELLPNAYESFTVLRGDPATGLLRVTRLHDDAGDVELADVDGDGDLDVLTGTARVFTGIIGGNDGFSVSLNDGSGRFEPNSEVFPENGGLPSGAVVTLTSGDINEDGFVDVISGRGSPFGVFTELDVWLGLGDGSFSDATVLELEYEPQDIELIDIDEDGTLDLVTTNASSFPDHVGVLLGDGSGQFAAPIYAEAGGNPGAIDFGDIDGNGTLDAVVMNRLTQDVSVLLGDGTGRLSRVGTLPIGEDLSGFALGDADDDGQLDVAVITRPGDLWLFRGLGAASFGAPEQLPIGPMAVSFFGAGDVIIADADGDGRTDLFVVSSGLRGLHILRGLEGGAFGPVMRHDVLAPVIDVDAFDANGDGLLDLALGSRTGAFVMLSELSR